MNSPQSFERQYTEPARIGKGISTFGKRFIFFSTYLIHTVFFFFYSLPAEICSPRPSERSSSLVFVPKCPQLLGCQQKRQGSNPDPRGYTQPRPQLKELVKQPEYIFWSIVR